MTGSMDTIGPVASAGMEPDSGNRGKSFRRIGKTRSSTHPEDMAKGKRISPGDIIYSLLGAIVPSCGEAMRMVEIGKERPLRPGERFVLLYNSPLCPHCNCNREKFNKERAKLREIEAARAGK